MRKKKYTRKGLIPAEKQPDMLPTGRRYPYYILPQCLKLGSIVKEHGGERAGVPKSVIAQGLNMDQGASNFSQLIASTKTFGIVEGTSELSLTNISREYFFPTSENGSRMAELEFLVQPTAFYHLIKRFDGSKLPKPTILGNLLGKECGIPASWRIRAAQIFMTRYRFGRIGSEW